VLLADEDLAAIGAKLKTMPNVELAEECVDLLAEVRQLKVEVTRLRRLLDAEWEREALDAAASTYHSGPGFMADAWGSTGQPS
jgi:hypothetical protein